MIKYGKEDTTYAFIYPIKRKWAKNTHKRTAPGPGRETVSQSGSAKSFKESLFSRGSNPVQS
jgi:hypothetical protein